MKINNTFYSKTEAEEFCGFLHEKLQDLNYTYSIDDDGGRNILQTYVLIELNTETYSRTAVNRLMASYHIGLGWYVPEVDKCFDLYVGGKMIKHV